MRYWVSMTGEWGDGYYVVVWDASADGPTITSVIRWDNWIRIPIEERSLFTSMVKAKDELDAFAVAQRGDTWINEGANNA